MRIKLVLASLALVLAGACGDNHGNQNKDGSVTPPADAHVDGSTPATIDASCFDLSTIPNPTNNEIINACTDADKIYKDSHPPLQGSDGTLPPLP